MEVSNFGVAVKDPRDQLVYVIIAHQPCIDHLLLFGISDQGKRKMFFVGLYFRGEAMNVAVFFHLGTENEYGSRLIEGILLFKRGMAEKKTPVMAGAEGPERNAAGAIASRNFFGNVDAIGIDALFTDLCGLLL